jgi:hypothetical protein
MTSLAAWVGVDTHGPASVYSATDSRISWGKATGAWDYGRKAFASERHPAVFGYVGAVLYPSLILSQFVSALDAGAMCPTSFDDMLVMLDRTVRATHSSLVAWEKTPFKIVVCGRDGQGMRSTFGIATLSWDVHSGYVLAGSSLPQQSDLVVNEGSGVNSVAPSLRKASGTPAMGTSRAVFSAFADSINRGVDPDSGGAPQLVGLYRIRGGKIFGVVNRGQRYLHGLPIEGRVVADDLEWRNQLFERCDGSTGRRLPGAQKH